MEDENLIRDVAECMAYAVYPAQTVQEDPDLIEAFTDEAKSVIEALEKAGWKGPEEATTVKREAWSRGKDDMAHYQQGARSKVPYPTNPY